MKKRCHYTGATKYYAYGAKGLAVCNRWRFGENGKSGFECFLADMGPKPSPQHSINRLNNNGHYEPANCAWSTPAEQARNRRSTIKVILGNTDDRTGRCETLVDYPGPGDTDNAPGD
jgi:hypothetical protein